jgi:flagellar hook-associated protein 3 FlgL
MRITNSMMNRSVLSDLNDVANRLTETQRKLSSGKEVNRPSDDPYRAGRAIGLRGDIEGMKQYGRNIDEALGWQTVTDTALTTMTKFVQRARELVVEGATETLSQADRDAIAQEIDQIIAGMKQEANATYDGRYVFAGTDTAARPYDSTLGTGNDTYAGDQIIATHLRSGDAESLGSADLSALDDEMDNLLAVQARVGAGMNRLETAKSRLLEVQEAATKMLSDVEDADMAKTIIDFNTQQAVYQSALKAGAQVIQPSLLDFLS